jgi:dipeptidyl aminopeptidase/acylaminoacyl peptidase
VQVPSKHGAGTIWGKYYGPKQMEAGRTYPIVMFVHGAGYLQNVSTRYPNYFREQMFHNLLVQRGYIVLDLDYRASEGYGRKWRTDIYRRMGTPELEDYLDGLDWIVANKQGDRAHAASTAAATAASWRSWRCSSSPACSRPARRCAR